MLLRTLDQPVETFRVDLRPDGADGGILALVWEKTEAYLPFKVK